MTDYTKEVEQYLKLLSKKDKGGYIIKEYREKNNISWRELANKCGVDVSYIFRIANNEKKFPSSEILKKIFNSLEVKSDDRVIFIEGIILSLMENYRDVLDKK